MADATDADALRGSRHDPEAICVLYDRYAARLLAAHGSKGLDSLLQPAIRHAEEGFVVTPKVAYDWASARERVERSVALDVQVENLPPQISATDGFAVTSPDALEPFIPPASKASKGRQGPWKR